MFIPNQINGQEENVEILFHGELQLLRGLRARELDFQGEGQRWKANV